MNEITWEDFTKKQIANFFSECLVTGFANESEQIVLIAPDTPVPNGARLM